MSDTITIRTTVDTGFAGAIHEEDHEVDRTDWEEMDESEQQTYLQSLAEDMVSNYIEANAEVVGEPE